MEDLFSPEGTYKVEYGAYEMAMSHTVYPPTIYRQSDRVRLLDMGNTLWSGLSAEWLSDSNLRLCTLLYPGRIYCDLTLDLETQTGQAVQGIYANRQSQPDEPTIQPPISFEGSLKEIQQWLARTSLSKNRR